MANNDDRPVGGRGQQAQQVSPARQAAAQGDMVAAILQQMHDNQVAADRRVLQMQDTMNHQLQQVMAMIQVQPGGGGGGGARPPPANSLAKIVRQPDPLSSEDSVASAYTWLRTFREFAAIHHLGQQTREEQLTAFRGYLTTDMRRILEKNIVVTAAVPGEPTLEETLIAVQAYFRGRTSINVDRRAFAMRRQHAGEPFDNFLAQLRELADTAELCQHCRDPTLSTQILTGILDDVVREKILAENNPTLDDIIRMCRAAETASVDKAKLEGSKQIEAVRKSAYKKGKEDSWSERELSRGRARDRGPSPGRRYDQRDQTCTRCGRWSHATGQECPARDARCHYCDKIGHYQIVCRTRQGDDDQDALQQPRRDLTPHPGRNPRGPRQNSPDRNKD
jgi:hypothetical protein